jgi:hypothetical protein
MKTLLQGVNEVFKKKRILVNQDELTSLTNSGLQIFIDTAIQNWNEFMDELYRSGNAPYPSELKEGTITLQTNIREYDLENDLVQLRYPFLDETNGREIQEYPGGYIAIVNTQLVPSNYTGLPQYGAISPEDDKIYLDRIPTANENGLVYKYRYDKDVSLSNANDTFPFTDAVFRAAVPAVAEYWSRDRRNKFDQAVFDKSFGRAAELLSKRHNANSWMTKSNYYNNTDPLNA